MFTKTRNKFLALSMAVSLLTLLVAFVTIYLMTADRTNTENLARLEERSVKSSDVITVGVAGGDAGDDVGGGGLGGGVGSVTDGGLGDGASAVVGGGLGDGAGGVTGSITDGGEASNISIVSESSIDETGAVNVTVDVKGPAESEEETDTVYSYSYAQYLPVFDIIVGGDGSVRSINAALDLSEKEYARIAEDAWKHRDAPTMIRAADRQWIYRVAQESSAVVQESSARSESNGAADKEVSTRAENSAANIEAGTRAENSAVNTEAGGDQFRITFLDVTESQLMLRDLRFTLLLISLAMLIVIFFVSLFFSKRAIRPLKTAWEKQQQFIADASHELKTPLSVIAANHDALTANPDQTVASQQEWLDYQKRGIERMSLLIDSLLSIARLENPNRREKLTRFDLSAVLNTEIALMEPAIKAKQLTFENDVAPGILFQGDEEQFRELFSILLDNAIKYSDEFGRVAVEAKSSTDEITIAVKNTGKGIPPEDIDKVFDRFYRGDTARSRKTEGHGLGLSIAKSIAEKLGGKIEVQSEKGKWTVFSVSIALS